MSRVYNFSAGPAVLPEEVLREAAAEMLDYQGSGMSVMEMSHRSKDFQAIIDDAEKDLRELMQIPDNYKVLFVQGGGNMQFAMVPMNLFKNKVGDYIITGQWAKKAYQEAKMFGTANAIASSADKTFSYIPDCSDLPVDEDADYVYICLNNTIYGTVYHELPNTKGKTLVADISSCFLSEPLDVSKFGILWGGVQKNVGPAGMAIVIIREDLNVKQAMSSLIDQAAKNDNISTIFVVNAQQKFYGAIDLKNLIIARRDETLEDLTVTSYPYVYAEEPINECIEELKDYSEDSIPVLDNDNRLLGVITSSNIIDLVDDEMGEDYAMFAGLTAEEDLKEPLKDSMKKRLPWLVVLMFLGMIVSSVVGIFESVVSQLTILMMFQSVILGMSGNAGTQSLAVTVRVLMDENLEVKQKIGLVAKEVRVGFGDGLLLGILSFIVLGIFIMIVKGRPAGFAFAVSGCIGLALMCSMVISSLTGTLVPMFFNKIGIDPAVASGPLITTINDLIAVIVYYGLSWLFLLEMMHL